MTKQRVTPRYVSVLLAVLAGILNVALTGIAFWLSYEHLHDVAAANGLPNHARAWAWPATLDTFIVIGEVLMLRASLAGKWDWWAASFMAIGSAGSITLNVVGVGDGAGTLAYIVAAVPPVAALLSFGMLMRQLHAAIKDYLAAVPAEPVSAEPQAPVSEEPSVPPVPVSQPSVSTPQPPVSAPSQPRLTKVNGTASQPVSLNHPGRPAETHFTPFQMSQRPSQKKRPRAAAGLVPPAPSQTVDLLTTSQAAGLAGVPASTIRTWKQREKLVPVVSDPDVLYSRASVLARMAEVRKP